MIITCKDERFLKTQAKKKLIYETNSFAVHNCVLLNKKILVALQLG